MMMNMITVRGLLFAYFYSKSYNKFFYGLSPTKMNALGLPL